METTRDGIRADLVELLRDIREDLGPDTKIEDCSGIFYDLGFESIDAVGLSTALEARFERVLPFPEFLAMLKQSNAKDITVGQLLDFLVANIHGTAERQT